MLFLQDVLVYDSYGRLITGIEDLVISLDKDKSQFVISLSISGIKYRSTILNINANGIVCIRVSRLEEVVDQPKKCNANHSDIEECVAAVNRITKTTLDNLFILKGGLY